MNWTDREQELMREARPLTSEGYYFIDRYGSLWRMLPSPTDDPGDPVRIEIVAKGWERRRG